MQLSRRNRSVLALAVAGGLSSVFSGSAEGQQNPYDLTIFHSTTSDVNSPTPTFSAGADANNPTAAYWLASTSTYSVTNPSTGTYTNPASVGSSVAPQAGYAYVDNGNYQVRTSNTSTNTIFNGDSLTFIPTVAPTTATIDSNGNPACGLFIKSPANTTITINNLVLANGGAVLNFNNLNPVLNGNIYLVDTGTTLDGITTTLSGGIIDARGGTTGMVINSTISGPGLLHVIQTGGNGSSFVTLTGNNTFSGGLNLDASINGTSSYPTPFPLINIDSPTALGTGTFTITGGPSGGGEFDNTTASAETLTTNNAIALNTSSLTFVGTKPLDMGNGTVTLGQTVSLSVNASTLTLDGAITGSPYTLTKTGAGTLQLTGASVSVPIVVSAGTLLSSNASTAFSSTVTVSPSATFALAVGGSGYNNSGISAFVASPFASFSSGSALGIDTTNATSGFTIPDTLNGSYGLSKLGPNTLTLTGTDNFGGPLNVSGGSLVLGGPTTLSSSSGLVIASGATLDLYGNSASVTGLTGGGTLTNSNASTLSMITFTGSSTSTFTGNISGGVGITVSMGSATSQTYFMGGNNTYTGPTILNSGLLAISSAVSPNTSITFNGGGLYFYSASDPSAQFNSSSPAAYNINMGAISAITFASTLNNPNGLIVTNGSPGSFSTTLNLGGANTKLGPVSVVGGTVEVTNTGETFGTISIASGATFAVLVGGSSPVTTTDLANVAGSISSSSLSNGGFFAIDTTGGNFTQASALTTAGFSKIGANTLTLGAANSFSAPVTLGVSSSSTAAVGTLTITNANALAGATALISQTASSSGASLDIATGSTATTLPPIVLNNGSSSASLNLVSDLPSSGPGVNYTFPSLAFNSSTGSLVTTAGANVSGGSPSITISSVTVNTASPVFAPGSATLSLGNVTGGTSGAHTLILEGTSGSGVITGAITNGNGAGAMSINESLGTGIYGWTLSGSSSYTGSTTVNAGQLYLTGQINNTSTLAISGGTNQSSAVYQSGASSNLNLTSTGASVIANSGGASGYYNLGGGTLNIAEELDTGGPSGTATSFAQFDMAGGNVNIQTSGGYEQFTVDRGGTGESAVVNITGGTVQISGGALVQDGGNQGLSTGWNTNQFSVITIGGIGSSTPANFLTPSIAVKLNHGTTTNGAANGSTGVFSTLNLDGGGTLQTLQVSGGTVAGTNTSVYVNFNGGTLEAGNAGSSSFIRNVAGVYIYSGGATINDNGQSITIAQPLLAPTLAGVSSVAITTAGSGYLAPPKVTFNSSNGAGFGATGYATINQTTGALTGIVITNPGTGYTAAPTVTLNASGGFVGTAASGFTVNTATNVGGGLTKLGVGTLTLSGSSTYTGTTNVSSGTLVLDHLSTGATGQLASPVLIGPSGSFLVKGSTSIGGLNVSGGGSVFNMADGTISTLAVAGPLAFGAGSIIDLDFSGSTNDTIAASGPATLSGVSTINLGTSPIANGNYTLMYASGGFNPSSGSFTVGTHPAGRISFSFNNSTATQEILSVSAIGFANTEYWTGKASASAGDSANNWTTGTTSSNFSIDPFGIADPNQVPGPVTDVYFTASSVNVSSNTLTTTLDAAYSIKGLYFAVPALSAGTQITATNLNLNANTLSLGADGLTLTSGSLSSGTIGSGSIVLSTNQTWSNNNATLPMTVNANVNGSSATTLTIGGSGAGGVTVNGIISDGAAPLALSISQPNTVLNGSNTYSGGTTIGGGSVTMGAVAALGSGGLTVNGGSLNLAGFSPTFPSLNGSGGTITNNGAAAANLTVSSGSFAGNITDGTAQVSITKITSGLLALSGSNTYSGNTNVSAGTLQFGSPTAASPKSAVSLGSSATLDLNGNSVAVGGLTGSGTVTNSGGATSTLTVHQPAGTSVLSGTVQDGNSPVALAFTGPGSQTLSGFNTYSAGTTITRGTVTAGTNTALGSGPITLNGGTLSLQYPSGSGVLTPFITGLSSSNFTVTANGSPGLNGSVLTLTDLNGGSESTAAFTTTPISYSGGFVASFTYTVESRFAAGQGAHYLGDGMTFTLQNSAANAIGSNGATLGYSGGSIGANSSAVALNLETNSGVAFLNNGTGTSTFNSIDPDLNGFTLEYSTAPVTANFTLTYNASSNTIYETINSSSGTYNTSFSNVNLASTIGSNSAYIGFTGSSGYDYALQNISNFTYSTLAGGPTSLANSVVAAPSTSSTIQLGVESGFTYGAIGSLSIGAGATVSVTASSLDSIATHGVLTTNGLSLAGSSNSWTGKLDLGNNSLVVHGGDLGTITNQVKQGYAGGTWLGSGGGGIISTAAASDPLHLTALGVIVNDNMGSPLYGTNGTIASTFGGATPADGDILVKYTYYGDANLDGSVNSADYALIDAGYLSAGSLTGWYNGDFNYDGVINGSDYTLIDNAFNMQGASLTSEIAAPTAQVAGGGVSAVPEPTSIALLGMTAVGLLGRRRRRI